MARLRVTVLPSTVQIANGESGVLDAGSTTEFKHVLTVLRCTAVSGAGSPTLRVFVQQEVADGSFTDLIAFAQVQGPTRRLGLLQFTPNNDFSEGAGFDGTSFPGSVNRLPLGSRFRIKWIVTPGRDPVTGDPLPASFTFEMHADLFS